MGWASGSRVMKAVIEGIRPVVPDEQRVAVYVALIRAFEDHDCDTLNECFDDDPAFLEAYCLDNPYEAGYRAARADAGAAENPHPGDTPAWFEWQAGFDDWWFCNGGN